MTRRTTSGVRMPVIRMLTFLALRLTLVPFVLREIVQRKRVTIIVYHAPSPQVLDAHLRVLKRLYNIISLALYVGARQTGDFSKLPPKALIITMDDGYRSNYALKAVIETHNIPVTLFLCSGLIG